MKSLNKYVQSGFALLFIIVINIAGFLAGYNYAYKSIRAETVEADPYMNMDGTCTDCADACIAWETELEAYQVSLTGKE